MTKSYWVALLLLFTGGVFGLHHFYLGRRRHAVLYVFTFGGSLIGLLHDLVRLRFYVDWANFDDDFKEDYLARTRKHPLPSMSFGRSLAMTVAAQLVGNLVHLALPADLLHPWVVAGLSVLLVPLAIATAVWYVGGIGELHGPFWSTLKVAYWTAPLYLVTSAQFITTVVCIYYFRQKWSYRLRPDKPASTSVASTVFGVAALFVVFGVLTCSMLMFNCTIDGGEAEPVKCRDALRHFFTSPLWKDIVQSLAEIRTSLLEGGWHHFVRTVVTLMDPTGEGHALQVLGVRSAASDDEIRKAYRSLSRKFHPDKNKFKSDAERQEAETRFLDVQRAFETLQLRRSRAQEEL